ncbi:MAG: HEAT repeat domain-containing protein [Microcoleus sp.]
MLSWDDFLAKVADKYSLFDEDDRQAFLKKLAQDSLGRVKSDAKVATELNISEVQFQRRLGNAYNAFSQSCPDLQSNKKGKLKILRNWLKGGYRDYQETGILPWLIEITSEVNQEVGVNHTPITLRDICGNRLEKQKKLTTNRLMLVKAMVFNIDDIDVDLALVERKKLDKRSGDDDPKKSWLYQPDYEETEKLEYPEFLAKVLKSSQSNKIAVIGEAGAGKTTLLQRIAFWILENTDYLPIWISLGSLPKPAPQLKEYLLNRWLEDALVSITPEIKANFEKQLTDGKVWLLLDGVDEMAASGNPFTFIDRWLPVWSQNLPVMLTCRLNVWEATPYALNGFQTYRTLWFSEEKVKKFIHDGFQKTEPALGVQLQEALNQSGKERIKDLVRNPLRLMLLCSIWHLLDGKLPDTKAELYQHYVEEVYRWKEEEFPTTPERQQLNAKLGELSKEAIDKQENRFCLQHKFIQDVFKNDSLFKLARNVNWLNQVGVDAKNPLQPVYAFFHPTFQEYFAATAIDDRYFFLPPQHQDKPVAEKYRIFEPQWKEVILLWLGRENIEAQKLEFIDALVNFEDGCGKWDWENIGKGFYEYRAYFLAASGINEFKSHPIAQKIVNQLVHLGLGYFSQEQQKWQNYIGVISGYVMINKILKQTDKLSTINEICSLLENSQYPESYYRRAISVLGEIGQGNYQSIAVLKRILNNTKNPEIKRQVLISLNEIESGQLSTIDRSIKTTTTIPVHHRKASNTEEVDKIQHFIELLLNEKSDKNTRMNALDKLQRVRQEDSRIINTLVEIIEKSNDPSLRDLALHYLGKIDRGGITVTRVSMKILENFEKEDKKLRFKAVISLRKSNPNNAGNNVDCLLSILNETKDPDLRIALLKALGKIGYDNPKAIATLTGILANTKDEEIRFQSADSLGRINPGNCKAVAVKIEILENTKHEYTSIVPALLKPFEDLWESSEALDSLGEIGKGSKNAIHALVKVLEIAKAEYARRRATKSLLKIITTDEHRQEVVSLLQPHLKTETYENNFDLFKDCYSVLWHCAQNLPYTTFYEAWHNPTVKPDLSVPETTADLPHDTKI